MFNRVKIVLSHTSHPGNIGSVARAMKTMGFSQLVLINPKIFPSDQANALSAGATDILTRAQVVSSLEEGLRDTHFVVALSARTRSLPWPLLSPRVGVEKIKAVLIPEDRTVALLFGTESAGLTNEELMRAHLHICIPSNPEYPSLNLAQAVQIMVYELRIILMDQEMEIDQWADKRDAPLASGEKLQGYFDHLARFLQKIEFLNPKQPKRLMARLHRLYARAGLDEQELNILRGMLKTMEKRLDLD